MIKKVTAIILAGGNGSRMCARTAKQNMLLIGVPLLKRTVEVFLSSEYISSLVVVVRESDVENTQKMLSSANKPIVVVAGGASRAESAKIGFSHVPNDTEYVAIHDGARCLITVENIGKVVERAILCGAASAASLVTETFKLADEKGNIEKTLPRERIYRAGTPQVFSAEKYRYALHEYKGKLELVTDDNMLFENIGESVALVDIGTENIKITTMTDLALAELILRKREDYV